MSHWSAVQALPSSQSKMSDCNVRSFSTDVNVSDERVLAQTFLKLLTPQSALEVIFEKLIPASPNKVSRLSALKKSAAVKLGVMSVKVPASALPFHWKTWGIS